MTVGMIGPKQLDVTVAAGCVRVTKRIVTVTTGFVFLTEPIATVTAGSATPTQGAVTVTQGSGAATKGGVTVAGCWRGPPHTIGTVTRGCKYELRSPKSRFPP